MEASDYIGGNKENNHLWVIVIFKCIPTFKYKIFPWSFLRRAVFVNALNMVIAFLNALNIADIVLHIL